MDRKTEIILAALELASENGLGTVSMNQIAEKIGISKPALYKHFESREEIVKALYSFLREKSKQNMASSAVNLEELLQKKSLSKILTTMVDSYRKICTEPDMFRFYKIIMSQRTIDKAATEIMLMETKRMIEATKNLFYVLQVKKLADFYDVDSAALTFAMSVSSIINYECDLMQIDDAKTDEDQSIKNKSDNNLMKNFIKEFCRVYEVKGEKEK